MTINQRSEWEDFKEKMKNDRRHFGHYAAYSVKYFVQQLIAKIDEQQDQIDALKKGITAHE